MPKFGTTILLSCIFPIPLSPTQLTMLLNLGANVIAVSLTTCWRRSVAFLLVSDMPLHILSLPYGFLECTVHSQRCLVLAGLSSSTLKITSLIDLSTEVSILTLTSTN